MVTAICTEGGREIARVDYDSAEAALAVYASIRGEDGGRFWEQTSPTTLVALPTRHNGMMRVELVGDI